MPMTSRRTNAGTVQELYDSFAEGDIESIREIMDPDVALLTWSGTYSDTGRSVEFGGAHVFDFEDGRIVRWTSYADTASFNAALED